MHTILSVAGVKFLLYWLIDWIEFECHIVKEHFQQLCFFVFFPLHRRPPGALTASRGFTRWMITPIGDLSSKSCSASWRRRAPPSHSVQPYRKILSISFVYTCTQRNGADIWRLVIFKTAKWHGMSTVVGLHGAGSTGRMFLIRNNLSWQRLCYDWIDVYLRKGHEKSR